MQEQLSRSGSFVKLSNSPAKAGPVSEANASPKSAYFWWVLLAFHALILIILNHNLIRPDLIRVSLVIKRMLSRYPDNRVSYLIFEFLPGHALC